MQPVVLCFRRTRPVFLALLLGLLFSPASSPSQDSPLDAARDLRRQGKRQEAKAVLLDALERDRKNPEMLHLLGTLYLEEGDYENAIKHGKKAIGLDESNALYHLLVARASGLKAMNSGMLKAMGAATESKREYEAAVELDPSNVDARLELLQYYLMAPGIAGGSEEKAAEQAAALEGLDPLSGSYAWAAVWEKREDFSRADSCLGQAVAADTSSIHQARFNLGNFQLRHNHCEEAEATFKEILRLDPEDMQAVYQIGKVYLQAKTDLHEAERCFLRYLEVEPPAYGAPWAAAHWRLGMVYDAQGRRDEALSAFRRAVEMDPGNKLFRKTLEEFENRR
jgi:tetratricopeptide (TPR) repeat protein